MHPSRSRPVVAGLAVAVVVLAAAVLSPAAVLEPIEALAADPVLFGAALLGLYVVRPFLAVPTMLCSAAVGYGFGVYGFPLAAVGAAVTALPPYYLTRWALATEATAEDFSGVVGRVLWSADRISAAGTEYFDTTGSVRGVTAARLAPVPADLITCGAAASGVSVGSLFAGTLVGELPWTLAAVLVGASAGQLSSVSDLRAVGTPALVAGVGIAALLLAGPAYRRLTDRGTEDAQ